MFCQLLQNKNVVLVDERKLYSSNMYNNDPSIRCSYKDPIEQEIKQLCKLHNYQQKQRDLDIQRVFIRGLGYTPELFNKACLNIERGA
ncbi:MAG: hypothetical protein RBS16_07605 [Candidatus Cloacimonadales bacterium]|jgi:hypothetical protein|nr:hypothetical protein [Candidatus Cloacimonadota bacterium]MDD2650819.1 hypothetical protein [Candidatus Cloacimonadota bacterium]MDD3501656.1 hypothetical protein [Candidatus Cloacimonadota bacterium]MDX9977880.1 hypothetical protein [Candidatus Cloacimonadales bacterium]